MNIQFECDERVLARLEAEARERGMEIAALVNEIVRARIETEKRNG